MTAGSAKSANTTLEAFVAELNPDPTGVAAAPAAAGVVALPGAPGAGVPHAADSTRAAITAADSARKWRRSCEEDMENSPLATGGPSTGVLLEQEVPGSILGSTARALKA